MKDNLNGDDLFDGRTLVIATMHGKEKVIAPLLESEMGVKCVTVDGMNTDEFGTFSGEVERKNSPLKTVRAKAMSALHLGNESLVIASEGSFGAHPASPFMSANEEMLILIDTKNNLEIVGRHLTVKTNYNHREISSLKVLEEFKTDIGYPEHGVILKIKAPDHKSIIHKDFSTSRELDTKVQKAIDNGLAVVAETDMRAMHNPTRMLAIEQAVFDLVNNIKSLCPECKAPGFVIYEVITGLPCELCRLPTKSAKAYVYRCQKCNYDVECQKKDKPFEDPMYCNYCNP